MLSLRRLSLIAGGLAALAACAPAAAPPAWQKAGATDQVVAADTAQCRALAQQQASRLYPYGMSPPALGGAGSIAAQQQSNIDRDAAQLQIFNECMEGKGYARGAAPAR